MWSVNGFYDVKTLGIGLINAHSSIMLHLKLSQKQWMMNNLASQVKKCALPNSHFHQYIPFTPHDETTGETSQKK